MLMVRRLLVYCQYILLTALVGFDLQQLGGVQGLVAVSPSPLLQGSLPVSQDLVSLAAA